MIHASHDLEDEVLVERRNESRLRRLENSCRTMAEVSSGVIDNVQARSDLLNMDQQIFKADLLYLVTEKFTTIDLRPDRVTNAEMCILFEELIRKFAELSSETAGEHFTSANSVTYQRARPALESEGA
jgi:type I restriction-modification system DNA methylase subunit